MLRNPIARLAIPAFFTLIAEPLFLMTDSAIIGHLGTRPLAALGAASTVILTATGIFIFLAYATTAIVARHVGAKNQDLAISAGLDGAWLALFLGLPLAALLAITAHPVALWMAGADVAGPATTYLRITALAVPAMLIALAAQGVLRGLQDTRSPLVITTMGFALNAGLNVFFVLGLHLGIAGSAIGTAVAQWLITVALLFAVLKRAHGVSLRPHPAQVMVAARAGLPLLVRTAALRAILLVTTALAGSFGTTALAAHQLANTIFSFLTFALDALAIAAQALVGEALGAHDRPRARQQTTVLLRSSVMCGAIAGVGLLAFSGVLPIIFTDDASVRSATTGALILIAVAQPMAGVLFVVDGILMGASDGVYLARVQVLMLACYLPLVGATMVWHNQIAHHGARVIVITLWALYLTILTLRCVFLYRRIRTDHWMHLSLA